MSDTDTPRQHVVSRAPRGAVDVDGIMQRLRSAQAPSLVPNMWRDAYERDVRFLLDQLGRDAS